jgi:hypothetical protein
MTELSPLGSLGTLTSGQMGDGLTHDEVITLKVGHARGFNSLQRCLAHQHAAQGRALWIKGAVSGRVVESFLLQLIEL